MTPATVALLVLGDTGTGDATQVAVAAAMAKWCADHPCDAVAMVGDNFYPNGVASVDDPQWQSSFEVPYAAFAIPFHPALGNHDYYGDPTVQPKYRSERWQMDGRFYSWDAGPADFYALDTEGWDRRQQRWLTRKLRRSDATWQVVYAHHPVHSSGRHGDNPDLAVSLLPILAWGGTDFYLAGHDHHAQVYEETPVLVIAGTGGAATRPTTPDPRSAFAASVNGFGWLLLTESTARYVFVDVQGAVLYDHTWSPPGPKPTGKPPSVPEPAPRVEEH